MNLMRLNAVARKEAIHVIRDPRSLTLAIALPLLLMILYGYALSLDVNNVPLVIFDQNRSSQSRAFITGFQDSRYFSVVGRAANYNDLVRAIDDGTALLGLVVPVNFAQLLASGRTAPVQLLVDGSDANTATIAEGYAFAVAQRFSRVTLATEMRRRGAAELRPPLELRPRVWFNEDMESRNFIIPGLIAVIMSVIAALLTSLTIAREWEMGTMEQLVSTPIRRHELIIGKLLPYCVIGMCGMTMCVVMGVNVFHVPLRGSVLLLFAMASLFLVGALSLGIVISAATRNQLLAVQTSMMASYLPAMLLSGFFVAIVNMPAPIRLITYLVPARYFVTLLKGIFLKGLGLRIMWPDAVFLGVFAAAMLLLAIAKFKKKLT